LPFKHLKHTLVPFRDAGEEPSDFECSVTDCLEGLERAIALGWYNFLAFDYKEFEHNHKLEHGDMNWLIPKKILALSSPTDTKSDGLPPQFFISKFKKMRIKAIVRLNEPLYDISPFTLAGIKVYDLEFLDGSCPSDEVIIRFGSICEREIKYGGGAIAVHCRAGLGRTGTLIGTYLMHRYNFEPKPLIAWLRIARPGSVIGIQQNFLVEVQQRIKKLHFSSKHPYVRKYDVEEEEEENMYVGEKKRRGLSEVKFEQAKFGGS